MIPLQFTLFNTYYEKEGEFCMIAQWIGEFVGKMHCNKITSTELALEMNVTREYISMILNGHRTPKDAKDRFNKALDNILESRGESQ
jgi:hypothetical protein